MGRALAFTAAVSLLLGVLLYSMYHAQLPLGYLSGLVIPKGSYNNKCHVLRDIWDKESSDRLLQMVKRREIYRTAQDDATSTVEHIGEARPVDADGNCDHPYLAPNKNQTLCTLPSRLDIARNYFTYGGRAEHKESYETLVSRVLGFFGFVFDEFESPDLKILFDSDAYQKAAADVCGGNNVFDPIQLGIIILLPGQEVPMHWDVPWFLGATRFTLPQWLLIAMEQSQLWQHLRVNQIQGVAYLHDWVDSATDGGAFFYYDDASNRDHHRAVTVPATYNTALVLDGSVVAHGVDVYRPARAPPRLDKRDRNTLRFAEGDAEGEWHLLREGGASVDETPAAKYRTEDLRVSFAWRARCFESEAAKDAWHNHTEQLSLESVLSTFVEDLTVRRRLSSEAPPPAPLDLALMILDEYVHYPQGTTLAAVNYCMAERFLPSMVAPLFRYVC